MTGFFRGIGGGSLEVLLGASGDVGDLGGLGGGSLGGSLRFVGGSQRISRGLLEGFEGLGGGSLGGCWRFVGGFQRI